MYNISRCGGYKKGIKPQALPGDIPGRLPIKGGVRYAVYTTIYYSIAGVCNPGNGKKIFLKKLKLEVEEMLKLVEYNEGTEKVLTKGTLKEVVNYLKENPELLDWMNYSPWTDDGSPETELPDLDEVETLRDLRYELSKINLSWWALEIEEE